MRLTTCKMLYARCRQSKTASQRGSRSPRIRGNSLCGERDKSRRTGNTISIKHTESHVHLSFESLLLQESTRLISPIGPISPISLPTVSVLRYACPPQPCRRRGPDSRPNMPAGLPRRSTVKTGATRGGSRARRATADLHASGCYPPQRSKARIHPPEKKRELIVCEAINSQ